MKQSSQSFDKPSILLREHLTGDDRIKHMMNKLIVVMARPLDPREQYFIEMFLKKIEFKEGITSEDIKEGIQYIADRFNNGFAHLDRGAANQCVKYLANLVYIAYPDRIKLMAPVVYDMLHDQEKDIPEYDVRKQTYQQLKQRASLETLERNEVNLFMVIARRAFEVAFGQRLLAYELQHGMHDVNDDHGVPKTNEALYQEINTAISQLEKKASTKAPVLLDELKEKAGWEWEWGVRSKQKTWRPEPEKRACSLLYEMQVKMALQADEQLVAQDDEMDQKVPDSKVVVFKPEDISFISRTAALLIIAFKTDQAHLKTAAFEIVRHLDGEHGYCINARKNVLNFVYAFLNEPVLSQCSAMTVNHYIGYLGKLKDNAVKDKLKQFLQQKIYHMKDYHALYHLYMVDHLDSYHRALYVNEDPSVDEGARIKCIEAAIQIQLNFFDELKNDPNFKQVDFKFEGSDMALLGQLIRLLDEPKMAHLGAADLNVLAALVNSQTKLTIQKIKKLRSPDKAPLAALADELRTVSRDVDMSGKQPELAETSEFKGRSKEQLFRWDTKIAVIKKGDPLEAHRSKPSAILTTALVAAGWGTQDKSRNLANRFWEEANVYRIEKHQRNPNYPVGPKSIVLDLVLMLKACDASLDRKAEKQPNLNKKKSELFGQLLKQVLGQYEGSFDELKAQGKLKTPEEYMQFDQITEELHCLDTRTWENMLANSKETQASKRISTFLNADQNRYPLAQLSMIERNMDDDFEHHHRTFRALSLDKVKAGETVISKEVCRKLYERQFYAHYFDALYGDDKAQAEEAMSLMKGFVYSASNQTQLAMQKQIYMKGKLADLALEQLPGGRPVLDQQIQASWAYQSMKYRLRQAGVSEPEIETIEAKTLERIRQGIQQLGKNSDPLRVVQREVARIDRIDSISENKMAK